MKIDHLFLFLLVLLVNVVFAQTDSTIAIGQKNIPSIKVRSTEKKSNDTSSIQAPVYIIAEEMPRFPGCESSSESVENKKACADQFFLKYINQNIVFPNVSLPPSNHIVVASFVVEANGSISSIKIIRSIGKLFDDEVIRVLSNMEKEKGPWTPAKQRGNNVRLEYKIPIRFRVH